MDELIEALQEVALREKEKQGGYKVPTTALVRSTGLGKKKN